MFGLSGSRSGATSSGCDSPLIPIALQFTRRPWALKLFFHSWFIVGKMRPIGRQLPLANWGESFLIALFVLIAIVVFKDFGITWDEQQSLDLGQFVINWYTSFFTDRRALELADFPNYGGLASIVSWISYKLLPGPLHYRTHVAYLIFAVAGLVFVGRLGRLCSGKWGGIFSILLLASYPLFFGSAFMNPRDVPFAATFIASLYYLCRLLMTPTRDSVKSKQRRRAILAFGVSCGLAVAIRSAALIFIPAFLFVTVIQLLPQNFANSKLGTLKQKIATFSRDSMRIIAETGIIVLLVYLTLFPFWPSAQVNPLLPIQVFLNGNVFGDIPTYFNGSVISTYDLPLSYYASWFLSSCSDFLLSLLIISSLAILFLSIRDRKSLKTFKVLIEIPTLVAIGVFCLFVFGIVLKRPRAYDGFRHFIFLIPVICVISSSLFVATLRSLKNKTLVVGATMLAGFSFLYTVKEMVLLHPYQYIYSNSYVEGGIKNRLKNNERDYWGLALHESIHWLGKKVAESKSLGSIRVYGSEFEYPGNIVKPLAIYIDMLAPNIRSRIEYVSEPNDADLAIELLRGHSLHKESPQEKIVHQIERHGVQLGLILDTGRNPKLAQQLKN